MGVAVGDIDNDGWVDVYVSQYGGGRLFRNRGAGPDGCSVAFLSDRDNERTTKLHVDVADVGGADAGAEA